MYQALFLPLFCAWEWGYAIHTKILILFLQVQVHNNFAGKYVGIEIYLGIKILHCMSLWQSQRICTKWALFLLQLIIAMYAVLHSVDTRDVIVELELFFNDSQALHW